MPDTFVKNNLSIVISFIVAVFTAGGIFAEFTALKDEIHLVHDRLDEKILVITKIEDRILELEKQLEYERGFLEANKKIFNSIKSINSKTVNNYFFDNIAICVLKITINQNEIIDVVDIVEFDDEGKILNITAYKG